MDVHPFLLVGVYFESIFAFASKHRTHNNVALGTNLRKVSQIKGFSQEKVKNIENVNIKGADCACWLVKML